MGARLTNITGAGVLSATDNDDGRAIADSYQLAFSAVSPGVSATVLVTTDAPDNPYNGLSHAVLLNGSTVYSDIIGGVDLIFQ